MFLFYDTCYWLFVFIFFLFKQKTAYEMRISDWSSDVCSSDLYFTDKSFRFQRAQEPEALVGEVGRHGRGITSSDYRRSALGRDRGLPENSGRAPVRSYEADANDARSCSPQSCSLSSSTCFVPSPACRSEEHTSELQSPMPISSAVFCLKKTNNTTH